MKRHRTLVLTVTCALIALGAHDAYAEDQGRFMGRLLVEPLDNGLDLKLESEFVYEDPKGELWKVPSGTVVNGASIPQAAWTMIGGPFSGKYRKASVVHDHYCVTKDRPWKSVHRMFYDAMQTSGVSGWKRDLMYWAVYQFGPRWEKGTRSVKVCAEMENGKCLRWVTEEKETLIVTQQKLEDEEFEKMKAMVKEKSLSANEIETLADKTLRTKDLDDIE